jgi:hypothetical protein
MKKQKQKSKPDDKKQKSPLKKETIQSGDKSGAFDFGGIPDRDLKKNLGCG